MGFKTATIFVSTAEPIYFSTNPDHQPTKATELIKLLDLGPAEAGELVPFFPDAMGLPKRQLALGAYEDGFVLSDCRLYGQVTEKHHEILEKIIANFPSSHILAIELESGVNLYGYALYDNGILIRSLGGYNTGCTIDFGPLQPEELPHFANSKIIDGELVFFSDIRGYPMPFELSAYGESLVFAMTHRFLGSYSDRWTSPGDELMLQLFIRQI